MIDITKPIYDRIETGDKTLDWILNILHQDKAIAEKEMKESTAKHEALSNFNCAISWVYKLAEDRRELLNQRVIINYLKRELIKKSYCRQVMKRQYRELKQKYDALKRVVENAENKSDNEDRKL